MQIRFCTNCDYKIRNDAYEHNIAESEDRKCPNCDNWLYSLYIEPDMIEITDFDELSIYDTNLKKLLQKFIEVIDVYIEPEETKPKQNGD